MIQLFAGDSFTAMYIRYMDIIQCSIVTNIDRKYLIMLTWTSSNIDRKYLIMLTWTSNINELKPFVHVFLELVQCTVHIVGWHTQKHIIKGWVPAETLY